MQVEKLYKSRCKFNFELSSLGTGGKPSKLVFVSPLRLFVGFLWFLFGCLADFVLHLLCNLCLVFVWPSLYRVFVWLCLVLVFVLVFVFSLSSLCLLFVFSSLLFSSLLFSSNHPQVGSKNLFGSHAGVIKIL